MPTQHEQFAVLDSDRVDLLCIARDMFTAIQARMASMNELSGEVFTCGAEEDAYIAAMKLLRKELNQGVGKPRKFRTGRTTLDCPAQEPPRSDGAIRIEDLGRISTPPS